MWPKNAPEALVTITRVTMEPGSISARHSHPNSEQIWIVERGRAALLMDQDQTDEVQAGDVVCTPAGSIHDVKNTGHEPFVYLAVTTPPQDFTPAYRGTADFKLTSRQAQGSPPDRLGQGGGSHHGPCPRRSRPAGAFARDRAYMSDA